MATYNNFVFIGHGTSEVTGAYDPGAVSGGVQEHILAEEIVNFAKAELDRTDLKIHYDENNYTDNDLAGNTYTNKCGIFVHINAGGGTGSEIFVGKTEKFLGPDFAILRKLEGIGLKSRGVKSRDYTTGATVQRTDGAALSGLDYYKEIRDAKSRGMAGAILEIGFIDTLHDRNVMLANKQKIGRFIAEYIADCNGIKLPDPISASTAKWRVSYDGKSYNAYGKAENVVKAIESLIGNAKKEIKIEVI